MLIDLKGLLLLTWLVVAGENVDDLAAAAVAAYSEDVLCALMVAKGE